MVEPGGVHGGRVHPLAVPRVQSEVVVVAVIAHEGRLVAVARDDIHAEHVLVEANRALDVGDLEVHVTDPDIRCNDLIHNDLRIRC